MDINLIQYLDPSSMWSPITHGASPPRLVTLAQLKLEPLSLYNILLELYPEYQKKNSLRSVR